MNLVGLVFRKDVVRTRWLLALYGLVLGLHLVMGLALNTPLASDYIWNLFFSGSISLLNIMDFLLMWILLAWVVLEDPVVGTKSFWFTRTVSRREMLGAKAAYAGLCLLLPRLVIEAVILLASGVPVISVIAGVAEVGVFALGGLVMVLWLAALSSSVAWFIIWYVSLTVVSMVFGMLIGMASVLFFGPEKFMGAGGPDHMWVIHVFFIGGLFAVVVHQYLKRRMLMGMLYGALVLLLMYVGMFSLFFLPSPKEAKAPSGLNEGGLEVVLEATCMGYDFSFLHFGELLKKAGGRFYIHGLPERYAVSPVVKDVELKWDTGELAQIEPSLDQSGFSTMRMQVMLRAFVAENFDASLFKEENFANVSQYDYTTLFKIPEKEFEAHEGETATLKAELRVRLYQYKEQARLAAQPGAFLEKGDEAIQVDSVLFDKGVVRIQGRIRSMSFAQLGFSGKVSNPMLNSMGYKYLLYNPERKEVLVQGADENPLAHLSGLPAGGALQVSSLNIFFPFAWVDEEWMKDAVLLRIALSEAGSFDTDFVDERYVLEDSYRRRAGEEVMKVSRSEGISKGLNVSEAGHRIDEILKPIQNSGRLSDEKEEEYVSALVKLGPDDVEELLAAQERYEYPCKDILERALQRLISTEHKEIVLRWLPAYPYLAGQVLKFGWEKEAWPTLIEGIKSRRRCHVDWVRAVASFQDPETYEDLKWQMVENLYPSVIYGAIKDLPGIELDETVAQAWRKVRIEDHYPRTAFIPIAIRHGHADAIRSAIIYLKEGEEYNRKRMIDALREHTPASGEAREIIAWYEANKDAELIFDPETRMYRIKP